MFLKILLITFITLSGQAMAYSTIDCTSNQGVTYLSHHKVGGVRPFPGMVTHLEEITKGNEVIYRKVNREECYQDDFCHIQQPELVDIISPDFSFSFILNSKQILSSEGTEMGPTKNETYAIQLLLDRYIWMICDSFFALYP